MLFERLIFGDEINVNPYAISHWRIIICDNILIFLIE